MSQKEHFSGFQSLNSKILATKVIRGYTLGFTGFITKSPVWVTRRLERIHISRFSGVSIVKFEKVNSGWDCKPVSRFCYIPSPQ